MGEWDQAEELVVTAEEREDLRFLMEKQRLERESARDPPALDRMRIRLP